MSDSIHVYNTAKAGAIDPAFVFVKTIDQELKRKFGDVKTNQLSFDQVDFYAERVKLTFFNEVGFNALNFEPVIFQGNIKGVQL